MVLGIAAYAAFLVATIPASLVAARVAAASGGAVEITDPQGTLWSGSARAAFLAPAGHVALDRVAWRIAPARLAAGNLAFNVTAEARGLDAKLTIGRGFSSWVLGSVEARIDASLAAMFAPLFAAAHPGGTFIVASPGLQLSDDGTARGKADVAWNDAALSLSDVKPLGTYSLVATADGGPTAFTVATRNGPLQLSGHGTFAPPSRVAFTGEARGEGDQARELESLLDLMGPRRTGGARALEIRIQR